MLNNQTKGRLDSPLGKPSKPKGYWWPLEGDPRGMGEYMMSRRKRRRLFLKKK